MSPFRQRFILTLLAVIFLASSRINGEQKRPNILFICTDQQQAGMLSCAGNPYLNTPALDSLSRTGVRFERAYCGNPVCLPSRVSMLCGMLPSRAGIEDNYGPPRLMSQEFLAHSMGRIVREAGYETAYGGKLHTPFGLRAIGFERITDDERQGLAEACVQFLNKKHDRPFLLVASFINPHDICLMALPEFIDVGGKRVRVGGNASPERCALAQALELPAGMSREEFFAKVCPPSPANFEIPSLEP